MLDAWHNIYSHWVSRHVRQLRRGITHALFTWLRRSESFFFVRRATLFGNTSGVNVDTAGAADVDRCRKHCISIVTGHDDQLRGTDAAYRHAPLQQEPPDHKDLVDKRTEHKVIDLTGGLCKLHKPFKKKPRRGKHIETTRDITTGTAVCGDIQISFMTLLQPTKIIIIYTYFSTKVLILSSTFDLLTVLWLFTKHRKEYLMLKISSVLKRDRLDLFVQRMVRRNKTILRAGCTNVT